MIGLLLICVPIALIGIGVSIHQYRTQIAHAERLSHASTVAAALDDLFAFVLQASNTSRRYVISEEPEKLDEYYTAVSAVQPALDRIKELIDGQDEFTAEFANLNDRLDAKLTHLKSILALQDDGDEQRLRSFLISGEGLERLEALRESVAAVRSIGYRVANRLLEQFRIGVMVQFLVVLMLIICGGVWATILGNETVRKLLIPVSSMIAQVQRIAAGNFGETIPVGQRDEIGRLAEQINHMTMQLRTTQEEREQARTALTEERQNLVDALEALNEGFIAYDSDDRILRFNQKYLEYFPSIAHLAQPGALYEDLLRHRVEQGSELAAESDANAFVEERLRDARLDAHSRECTLSDHRVLRRSSYRTRNGGRVAVYVDISDIKRAQNDLVELNQNLDARVQRRTNDLNQTNELLQRVNAEMGALITSAPVAIVALSRDREVTTWNPAALNLTGLSIDAIQPGLANVIEPESADAFTEFLEQAYNGDSPPGREIRLRHTDGRTVVTSISASVLSDSNDRAIGTILIIADLTEARSLQQQVQQSQKMEVVARLTAGLAHDFNNLLAIIISNIELLESRVPPHGAEQDMLAAAKKAGMTGVALNKKLLTFSRDQSLQVEGLDIRNELESLEPLLQITLGEGILLRLTETPDLWYASADCSLLQSAVLNLAANARDAMAGNGTLEIVARNVSLRPGENKNGLMGDYVRITFTDTGEGMTEDVLAQVFQPFFTTKDFGKGSGLGLSMVYGFIKQSGGDISIESTPNVGTTVAMLLPRAELSPDVLQGNLSDGAPANGSGETILVVEDNSDIRRAVAIQLADMGFAPIEAESGATALELLDAGIDIDLMLTDIMMPGGIDGRELARRARNLRANLPIIYMSGYAANGEDSGTEESTDQEFKMLSKPVDKKTLGLQINKTLAEAKINRPIGYRNSEVMTPATTESNSSREIA